MRSASVKQMPADRAKITTIDKSNPSFPAVCIVWTDAKMQPDDFNLSELGDVEAIQSDLLACPPRGWVMLRGECRRKLGSFVKLLPKRLRPKRL